MRIPLPVTKLWLGKLIGSIIGLLLTGHWLGVLLGLLLGHVYDQFSAFNQLTGGLFSLKNLWRKNRNHPLRGAFVETLFLVLGKLAKSDGRVSEAEISWTEGLIQRLHLSEPQRKQAIDYFNQGKDPSFNIEPLVREFARYAVPLGLNFIFMEILVQCARSDGALHPSEIELLRNVSQQLRVPQQRLEALLYRPHQTEQTQQKGNTTHHTHIQGNSIDDAYTLLGIDSKASRTEIKKAYRRLMGQHHPDKLVAKGLPEEMMAIAKEKTQEIQAAYDQICRARGFKS